MVMPLVGIVPMIFFENAEMKEKLQNSLKEAFASAMATEIEKLTKQA